MKKLIATLAIITATVVPVTVAANLASQKTGATEEPPIIQEIRHQGEVIDNHEDRITNTEADVADLQANTNTPPSQTRTVVREVQTPAPTEPVTVPAPDPTPEPAPVPVTVVAYLQIPTGEGYMNENMDCEYTYSDGTTYRWLWREVEFNQVKITRTHGNCSATAIGRVK